jgi:hypothetical protein
VAQSEREIGDSVAQVRMAVDRINAITGKLEAAISNTPDFGKLAVGNTARIARMLRIAPTLPDDQRAQLGVEANQVEVETNQIEVERSQYAIGLNGLVDDAKRAAEPVTAHCLTTPPIQLAQVCAAGKASLAKHETAVARGRAIFTPHKQRVRLEIERQRKLTAQIDG